MSWCRMWKVFRDSVNDRLRVITRVHFEQLVEEGTVDKNTARVQNFFNQFYEKLDTQIRIYCNKAVLPREEYGRQYYIDIITEILYDEISHFIKLHAFLQEDDLPRSIQVNMWNYINNELRLIKDRIISKVTEYVDRNLDRDPPPVDDLTDDEIDEH